MLDTLLDFSRIEAGVVEPQMQAFHLQPLLNRIENELAPQADAKGIVYRSRETDAAVHSDPALVELILRNLVSNAIRYTERGGVLVACRARGDAAAARGVGHRHRHRADAAPGRSFASSTSWATRSATAARAWAWAWPSRRAWRARSGQQLALVSEPGRGSVFRLGLPLAQRGVVTGRADTTPSRARVFDVRVLVIDDDESVRAGMRQLLGAWGCECDVADSIEEAQALRARHPPGLVISDYRLRELRTGAEAIAALRAEFGAAAARAADHRRHRAAAAARSARQRRAAAAQAGARRASSTAR